MANCLPSALTKVVQSWSTFASASTTVVAEVSNVKQFVYDLMSEYKIEQFLVKSKLIFTLYIVLIYIEN